jgi:hypothetical protein
MVAIGRAPSKEFVMNEQKPGAKGDPGRQTGARSERVGDAARDAEARPAARASLLSRLRRPAARAYNGRLEHHTGSPPCLPLR